MHNLAIALKLKGFSISGSDDIIRDPSKSRLAKHGLLPESEGWFPEKINKDLDRDVLKIFDLKNSMNSKKSYGGTAEANVKMMIKKYKKETR